MILNSSFTSVHFVSLTDDWTPALEKKTSTSLGASVTNYQILVTTKRVGFFCFVSDLRVFTLFKSVIRTLRFRRLRTRSWPIHRVTDVVLGVFFFFFFNWTFRSRLGRTWKNTVLNKTAFTPCLSWPKGIHTHTHRRMPLTPVLRRVRRNIYTHTHNQRRRCTGVRIINNMLISIMRFYACRPGSSQNIIFIFRIFFFLFRISSSPPFHPQVYITLGIISTLHYHYSVHATTWKINQKIFYRFYHDNAARRLTRTFDRRTSVIFVSDEYITTDNNRYVQKFNGGNRHVVYRINYTVRLPYGRSGLTITVACYRRRIPYVKTRSDSLWTIQTNETLFFKRT